jgi:hypothetical protein
MGGLKLREECEMKCSICGKRVPKHYVESHKKFHVLKNVKQVIKAAKGLKLHAFDKEVS